MTSTLPNAVSAASLVLGVLAALYTLWLPHVVAALDLKPERDPADREPQRRQARMVLLSRATPLFTAGMAATAVLLPRTIGIVAEAARHHDDWRYDDVKAFMVLTWLLLLLLSGVALVQVVGLGRKIAALKST